MTPDSVVTILFWTISIVTISVVYDFASYPARQDRWEREHPGATYIRHYRRFEKQSAKARKLGGEV